MSAYKFQMTFSNGMSCTVIFDPAIHWDELTKCPRPLKKWHPKPKHEESDAVFPEYVEWMHTVHLSISKIVKTAYSGIVQNRHCTNPTWALWKYYPNGKKKCIKKGDGFFDPYA